MTSATDPFLIIGSQDALGVGENVDSPPSRLTGDRCAASLISCASAPGSTRHLEVLSRKCRRRKELKKVWLLSTTIQIFTDFSSFSLKVFLDFKIIEGFPNERLWQLRLWGELFRHLRLNGYDRKRGTGCETTCTLSTRGECIFNLQSLTLILCHIGSSLHFCQITVTNLWRTMHTRRHAYMSVIHRCSLSFSYVKREEDAIISLNYVRRQMLWMEFSKHEIRALRERSLLVSVLSCGLPEVSECVTDRLCGSAYFCPSFKEPLSLSPAHLPT